MRKFLYKTFLAILTFAVVFSLWLKVPKLPEAHANAVVSAGTTINSLNTINNLNAANMRRQQEEQKQEVKPSAVSSSLTTVTDPVLVFQKGSKEVYQYVTIEQRLGMSVKTICNVAHVANSSVISISCVKAN